MKNKPLLYFLISLTVILLGIVGYFVYLTLTGAKEDKSDETTQEETVDEDENSNEVVEETPDDTDTQNGEEEETINEPTLPEGWSQQESTTYGYKIGVPNGWYYRFFSSTKMIGLDPNPIPEASEYAGVITFSVDDRPFNQMLSETQDYLENETTDTLTVNSIVWTEVNGKIPMDDFFNPGESILYAMAEVDGVSYRVTLISPNNSEYMEVYTQLLTTISFE